MERGNQQYPQLSGELLSPFGKEKGPSRTTHYVYTKVLNRPEDIRGEGKGSEEVFPLRKKPAKGVEQVEPNAS